MNEIPRPDEDFARRSESEERSLAELMKQLSEQASTLAQKEVELAKAELAVKAKRLGIGAGALGAASLLGLLALGALTATLILALSTAVAAWLAALIVTAVYGALAGGLAVLGKIRVEAGTPPVPKQAVDSVKEDWEWAKTKAKQART